MSEIKKASYEVKKIYITIWITILLLIFLLTVGIINFLISVITQQRIIIEQQQEIIKNNVIYSQNILKLCKLREPITLAKSIHEYWKDHPELYEKYDGIISNKEWDQKWIDVYSEFLNITEEFCFENDFNQHVSFR